MAIIPLPTRFEFKAIKHFKLERRSLEVRSRYTATRQIVEYPYAIWQLSGNLMDYDGKEAADLRAFLVQLRGKVNGFRLPVPGYTRPSTGYLGDAQTNGVAAARALSIGVDGLTPNAQIIRNGEYFNIGEELKLAVGDVQANASGQAIINFEPFLRYAKPDNTFVYLQKPTIIMHMAVDDAASWGLEAPVRHKTSFDAIEMINQ